MISELFVRDATNGAGGARKRTARIEGVARRLGSWTMAIFAAVLALAPALVRGADLCQGTLKKLSDCTPSADRDVSIGTPTCRQVYADKSFIGAGAFRKITIQSGGALCVRDSDVAQQPNKELTIQASTISVQGTLEVGNSAKPIGTASATNHVTFIFTGPKAGALSQGQCADKDFYKGIEVCNGGTLRLFGKKGIPALPNTSPSWTYLSQPAGDPAKYGATSQNQPTKIGSPVTQPNAKTITVADGVGTDWQGGDWIAIGTTSFSPFETEFVQIADGGINGKTITLKHDLKYYHFGSPAPDNTTSDPNCKDARGKLMPASFCQGKEYNYGVDERAEVGLISRNIKLTSDAGAADRLHWGGEIILRENYAEASIQGVEIEKFGKDKLGSYPIHFHMDGKITKPTLINANSIHHSYNKCVTVHETSNVTIQNNVCARIVGHIFYEETGNEENITFQNNLGLGAMSNSFDIAATTGPKGQSRADLIRKYWWTGDNLTNDTGSASYNAYDGFNIPNTDKQTNPVHGSCQVKLADGSLGSPVRGPVPPCQNNEIYVEPANGFWITHPGTKLIGNSIGGCQGVGRGYWYVTPPNSGLEFKQITFQNNRVHSCYDGLYGENEYTMQSSQTLNPRVGGVAGGQPLIATIDGLTATRNRDRGVWMRPLWFVVTNSRFATNRDSVVLLTSGGIDGNAPGAWELLKDSVVVGLSANNIERFGPCPEADQAGQGTGYSGKNFGCIDRTPGAADEVGKGYPDYKWNFAGYMIYDGPVRIFNDRFVNFNVKPAFTAADQTFLDAFNSAHPFGIPPAPPNTLTPFQYEGDAAIGWFQANQSAYPNATASQELRFENVDLRHQIYTDETGIVLSGVFNDSDKNTAILDRDGTLTGLVVRGSTGGVVHETFPMSLNNLEFNAARLPDSTGTISSVNECQSTGAQDALFEKRPTSLITPADIGTLEFFALFPNLSDIVGHKQLITFMKDSTDYGRHASMTLHGRDGRGVFEPRVASGYGYTITAAPDPNGPRNCGPGNNQPCAGIPNWIDIGVADVIKAGISKDNPFYTRIGICYTDENGKHPDDKFEILRGYKGYGGSGVPVSIDPLLNVYFNNLNEQYNGESCHDLDGSNPKNYLDPVKGCPANGVVSLMTVNGVTAPCPSGQKTTILGNPYCVYPKAAAPLASVPAATGISGLLTGGKPDLTKYYYDKPTGMLFFYVAQTLPNAVGPSPLGSCTGKPSDPPECPNQSGESYYVCPAPGCEIAIVRLGDPNYKPGRSNCGNEGGVSPYDPAKIYAVGKDANNLGKFEQAPPDNQNRLALASNNQIVIGIKEELVPGFAHAKPSPAPACELLQ